MNSKPNFLILFIFVTALGIPDSVWAQMFSVGNNGRVFAPPTSAVVAGIEPFEFNFTGDPDQLEADQAPDYTFYDPVYRLRVEIPGFHLYGGYGRNLSENDNLNYLNIGLSLTGGMNVWNRPRFTLVVPLEINTEYTQVINNTVSDRSNEFRQSAILIGAGLGFRIQPTDRIRIISRGLPMIGFSVSSHSGQGGVKYQIENRNRIYLDNLFGRTGLVFGVDFRFSDYNSEQNRFQYESFGNSLMIGISF